TRIAVFNHFRSLIIRQSVAVQRVVAAYDNGWLFVFYVNVSPARVSADAVQHFDLQILPQVVGADKWRAGQHGVLVHYDGFNGAIRAPLRRLQNHVGKHFQVAARVDADLHFLVAGHGTLSVQGRWIADTQKYQQSKTHEKLV